jgi:hypothetical protein
MIASAQAEGHARPVSPGSNNAGNRAGIALEICDLENMMVAWKNLFAIAVPSTASL